MVIITIKLVSNVSVVLFDYSDELGFCSSSSDEDFY